jgi:hypothetical protein
MRAAVLLLLFLPAAIAVASGSNDLTFKELSAARKIYVAKCAKCHRFYEPKDYSDADWASWLEKMSRKSKLKEEQSTLLRRYLDAYRTGEVAGKPETKPVPPERKSG